MSRPPFFAFYPADFAGDINVEAMTTLQVGAYILLLCKAWQADPPASLPNDDQILARLARLDAVEWSEAKAGVLSPFVLGTDDRWHQKRLRQEYEKAKTLIRSRSQAGKEGADRRWQRHGKGMAQPMPEQCDGNGIQSQSQKQTQKKPEDPPTPQPGGAGAYPARPADGTEDDPGPDRRRPRRGGTSDPAAAEAIATAAGESPPARVSPEEVAGAWNAAGLRAVLLPAGRVDPGLGRTLRARLGDPWWAEHWRAGVARCAASRKCLTGEGMNWTGASLDWFAKEGTLRQVLEGQFDDPAPKARPAGETAAERFARLEAEKKARQEGGT